VTSEVEIDVGQIKALGAARCRASGKPAGAELADSSPRTSCLLCGNTP
jgi:hypothetical protein